MLKKLSKENNMKISISKNAQVVLEKRYLKKDDSGKAIESPENMFQRVARSVAEADRLFDPDTDVKKTEIQFQKLLANLWFLPNSPHHDECGQAAGTAGGVFRASHRRLHGIYFWNRQNHSHDS